MTKDDDDQCLSLFNLPPTPDEIPLAAGQRLIATGDVHGNISLLRKNLMAAGIVDNEQGKNWTGGNAILVQVGDVLDRGTSELDCLLLLCKLGRQAQEVDGAVVVLWGNHEVENATGEFGCSRDYGNKWSKMFGSTLKDLDGSNWKETYSMNDIDTRYDPARWAAMQPGGLLAAPLLSKLKMAVKVGRTVLVHAGLTVNHADGGITTMNHAASEWISKKFNSREHALANLPQDMQSYSFVDVESPLWMRDYSCPANKTPMRHDARSMVEAVLEELDVDRMVVGHTIQEGINSVFDGKVWRIDIGDGVPMRVRFSSCIEDLKEVRREALEITRIGSDDGKEKVAVLRRIQHSTSGKKSIEIVRDENR